MVEAKQSTASASPYLFKGLLLYLVLPLLSILAALETENGSILFTALSCCICVIYDCYTRHNETDGRIKTAKIFIIGIIYAVELCLILWAVMQYLSGHIGINPRIFLPLGIAPLVGLIDFGKMVWLEIMMRGV